MARRKRSYRRYFPRRRRSRGSMTIPIAPIIGLSAGMAGPLQNLVAGDFQGAMNGLKQNYLGLDTSNNFNAGSLWQGLVPLVMGMLVHKFVGGRPLNFNSTLSKAKVPYIRI